MLKNIDSQLRMVELKPAIPDVFLHKCGLARTQKFKVLMKRNFWLLLCLTQKTI